MTKRWRKNCSKCSRLKKRRVITDAHDLDEDEAIRHFAKQFMKDKPKKFCFKLWALVDIFGPYIQNFDVYQGRREASHSHHGTASCPEQRC